MVRVVRKSSLAADFDSTMTPMIDIVFLLLVFFVWTYSFQAIELILPHELATLTGDANTAVFPPPAEQDFEPIVVRIGWNGQTAAWEINKSPIATLDVLIEELKKIQSIRADAPVVVHPDSVVPLRFVINGFDAARQAGFSKISLAANL